MIIRFAKRKAAWEETSAEVIRDIEFRRKDGEYDLRPSVYCIDGRESVRCFAEHAAAAPIEMPASALGLDFTDTKSFHWLTRRAAVNSNSLSNAIAKSSRKARRICAV